MSAFSMENRSTKAIIEVLRERGGSAVINLNELGRTNSIAVCTLLQASRTLEKMGFLTVEKNVECVASRGIASHRYTLNEKAIAAYEASGKTPAVPRTANTERSNSTSKRTGVVNPKLKEVTRDLQLLNAHAFQETTKSLVQDLLDIATLFVAECQRLETEVASLKGDSDKLSAVALGLEATEKELTLSTTVSAEEIAGNVDYKAMPGVPAVDFVKLLSDKSESLKIFRPLGRLQHGTQYLSNLIVEHQREVVRLTLINGKLDCLVAELQSVETVDFSRDVRDWKKRGDKVAQGQITGAIAVVSSNK